MHKHMHCRRLVPCQVRGGEDEKDEVKAYWRAASQKKKTNGKLMENDEQQPPGFLLPADQGRG